MNRIKKWLEQDPQRMHFIKIGLVLLGIILLIALPTLYLVLSGIGIWYFVKKAPDIRKRNLMIGLFVVSFVAVALQTPTVTRKLHLLSQKLSRLRHLLLRQLQPLILHLV